MATKAKKGKHQKSTIKKAKPIKKIVAKAKKSPKKAAVKKAVPKAKSLVKKVKVKAPKKVVKKVVKKKTVAKKPAIKKAVAKAAKPTKKPVAKTAKLIKTPAVKAVAKKVTKVPAKPVKKKGPPVVIPSMNHKTVAEKIEARKASPMKLQASKTNIGVVSLVPSIPSYRVSPGEEYMNESQKKHFLDVLHAKRQQLMEDVDKTVSHLKDDAENYADLNDRASQEEEFSTELRKRDRDRKLLKKIEDTIVRLENGDFGYCEACGVEIGLPRLEARPTATQCIDCKEVEELREKQLTL